MVYTVPSRAVPSWFKVSDLSVEKREDLDSFGLQWAQCKMDPSENNGKCDLYAYVPDQGEVKYGEFYFAPDKSAAVLPPGVFEYSGFDFSDVKEVYDCESKEWKQIEDPNEAPYLIARSCAVYVER